MQTLKPIKAFFLLAALLPLTACNPFADEPAQAVQTGNSASKQASGGHDGHEDEGEGHVEDEAGHEEHDEHAKSESKGGHDDEESSGEHEGEGKREIHLTQTQRDRLDVKVAKAKAGSATAMVQAPATVAFDADKVARVGPRLEAKVVKVTKDLGDKVSAGEPVAVFDSVALGQAKARYLTAQARHGAALAEYQRDKGLAEQQITSEAELLESKAAYLEARAGRDANRAELRLYGLDDRAISNVSTGGKQPLSRYTLFAPIAGTIQRRDLVPGQTVSAQQTPVHIVNSDEMWVFIEAYEQDLARLKTGLAVSLSVRALPGETFEGKTDWVSSELDEQARTVRVRATVPNPDGKLRAGMFGTARIQADSQQSYALVPIDAVQTIEGEDVVFIPGGEANEFEAVEVVIGSEGDGQIEIRQGLMPGDSVVTVGAFDLNSALSAGSRSAEHSH